MTKLTKYHVRPAKTQISLGIHPHWSESSLSAWRKLGSLATYWVHSEDFDQTERMSWLIWVFAGRTCHFVMYCKKMLHWLLHWPLLGLQIVSVIPSECIPKVTYVHVHIIDTDQTPLYKVSDLGRHGIHNAKHEWVKHILLCRIKRNGEWTSKQTLTNLLCNRFISKYCLSSMARTSFRPWTFVLDMGSLFDLL